MARMKPDRSQAVRRSPKLFGCERLRVLAEILAGLLKGVKDGCDER
jgi:hypothetical protein